MNKLHQRVVFICGCLETGKDGVGDYVQNLMRSLNQEVIKAKAIAINDQYVTALNFNPLSVSGDQLLYRIPRQIKEGKRFEILKMLLAQIEPDWISLQFVIYSYHKKGLPFKLPYWYKSLRANYKWHIMFHETWVGFNTTASLKHKVYGSLQKSIIKKLLHHLQPEVITVSHFIYKHLLEQLGYSPELVPLISNIPKLNFSKEPLKINNYPQLVDIDFDQGTAIGIFATVYPEADLIEPLKTIIKTYARQPYRLITFGNGGVYYDQKIKAVRSYFGKDIEILELGRQPEIVIAYLLENISCAICCTPLQHISKSGVYAAYRRYELPVFFANSLLLEDFKVLSQKELKNLKELNANHFDVNHLTHYYEQVLASDLKEYHL